MKERNSRWNLKTSFIWVPILALIGVVGFNFLFEVFGGQYHTHQTSAISNLKQLELSMIFYSEDWNDKYPIVHPYEFGIDPIEAYHKRSELHSNPFPPNKSNRAPNTTQHRFQYVLNPKCLVDGRDARLILGPISAIENPEQVINLTSVQLNGDGLLIISAYVDGHVRPFEKSKLGTTMPPYGDFPTPLRLDELLYVHPDDKSPTQFWAVPYEAVAMAARGGKK